VKGKLAIGVGSQCSHTTSERGVSSITNADAHTSAAPADLNGRVRLGERRNLVAALVPSRFKRTILYYVADSELFGALQTTRASFI
jgi:hypothetical protein